ncbi:MAG: hypothetical protein AAGA54_32700 [Myxococcota bacterium]
MSTPRSWLLGLSILGATGCSAAEGLLPAPEADVTVKFDFDARPLPEIPLPNDIATRPSDDALTGMRLNASVIAPTNMEARTRTLIDGLDGWGLYQPITIPFTDDIDPMSVVNRHRDADYDTTDDAVYLINIDRDSDEFGRVHHLDFGNGNYPVILERRDKYGSNDPRGDSMSLMFEETDEDLNGNGRLDPGEDENHNGVLDDGEDRNGNGVLDLPEDTDADGVLDKPNYLPGHSPAADDLIGRADALMTFYEKETHTLIARPMTPLQEQTTYAVVVTRRIRDADGEPIGSPFAFVNHAAQTKTLEPLLEVLPEGLDETDIAFAFPYTTQSVTSDWIAVREGLYGHGTQSHLAEDFPAELAQLFELKDVSSGSKFDGRSPFVLHHEDWQPVLTLAAIALLGLDGNSEQAKSMLDSHNYVDFHAMGTYQSPQLFDRFDEDGQPLNLDLQSWPSDLHRQPVSARAEEVPFWAVIPRKEVSARGEGKMAPVVLLGHGYTSNRVGEIIGFSGFLSMFGVATVSTDNVSHGLGLAEADIGQLRGLLEGNGLGPSAEAVEFVRGGFVDDDGDGEPDRHFQDLDRDGVVDSGADFWTSYLFHTRDNMRQSSLDYMQLIRIIRSWDGVKTWPMDTNGNGLADDLAGDFDGDGIVDIGSESPIYMLGASLGGIMATTLGAVEPEVEAIVPIAGGGRLADVGARSLQGGVPDAVMMRVMGPTFQVTVNDDGSARVFTQFTELNNLIDVPIRTLVPPAAVDAEGRPGSDVTLQPGDTMLATNVVNGEVACAYVLPDEADNGVSGRARVALPSDAGDAVELSFYRGPVLETGNDECELVEDPGDPLIVIDQMQTPFDAEGNPYTLEGVPIPGGPLTALAEGLGLDRNKPELRRFMGLGQMILDPTDPGVVSRYLAQDSVEYPNVGDETGARYLIVTTIGDMNVPAHSGVTVARAAGAVDYLNVDPRWGVPPNQVLIDTHNTEAVNTLGRHVFGTTPETDEERSLLGLDGSLGVHVDVENFSEGDDIWGDDIPRLDEPLRLVSTTDAYGNDTGGYSGAVFPYAIPQGQHGFALPGQMTDWAKELCDPAEQSCADADVVGQTYDVGWAMFHMLGTFLLNPDRNPLDARCWTKEACNDLPPTPPLRDPSTLP